MSETNKGKKSLIRDSYVFCNDSVIPEKYAHLKEIKIRAFAI